MESFIKDSQRVQQIISLLQQQLVDGETMQYILERVGMEYQMLRQLMMSQPIEEVEGLFDERYELEISKGIR